MLESEKFAIAAHLHVLLRRTNGRVTDVEWMIRSPEYAREVIRVARGETHADLHKLADKLEAAIAVPVPAPPGPTRPVVSASASVPAVQHSRPVLAQTDAGVDSSGFGASSGFAPSGYGGAAGRKRYVGTLR
jgi:hypothetical protein